MDGVIRDSYAMFHRSFRRCLGSPIPIFVRPLVLGELTLPWNPTAAFVAVLRRRPGHRAGYGADQDSWVPYHDDRLYRDTWT